MNNSAQTTIFYSLMLGLVIIILALAIAPSVQSFVNDAMNQTTYTNYSYTEMNESGDLVEINGTIENIGMDCSNSSISNFAKAGCVVTDFSSFYIIAILIFIGGAIILSKIIIG